LTAGAILVGKLKEDDMSLKAKGQNLAIDVLRKYFQDVGNDEEVARVYAETLGPEGTAFLLTRMSGIATDSDENIDPSLGEFLSTKKFSEKEKRTLEITSLYNFFKRRHELLANSVGSVEAAEMLGVSKQTIHDRIRENKLIGLVESNVMRLPLFQFDPAGPNGAVAGLPEVLKELSGSLLGKVTWLVSPNAVLDGKAPIEIMKGGDLERVLREARSVGIA
jgi:hypothetical protein